MPGEGFVERMQAMVWLRALAVWGVMLVAMVCNGGGRDALLKDRFGEHRANQISVITGSTILLGITALFWPWIDIKTAGMAWGVGLMWMGLTLAFEFGFMHFVAGASWERLLSEYNVLRGRLWPLALTTTLLAPQIIRWLRGS